MARTAAQPAGISRIARGALKKYLVFEDEYSMYNSRYYSGVCSRKVSVYSLYAFLGCSIYSP